jgi:hypothetical protein
LIGRAEADRVAALFPGWNSFFSFPSLFFLFPLSLPLCPRVILRGGARVARNGPDFQREFPAAQRGRSLPSALEFDGIRQVPSRFQVVANVCVGFAFHVVTRARDIDLAGCFYGALLTGGIAAICFTLGDPAEPFPISAIAAAMSTLNNVL